MQFNPAIHPESGKLAVGLVEVVEHVQPLEHQDGNRFDQGNGPGNTLWEESVTSRDDAGRVHLVDEDGNRWWALELESDAHGKVRRSLQSTHRRLRTSGRFASPFQERATSSRGEPPLPPAEIQQTGGALRLGDAARPSHSAGEVSTCGAALPSSVRSSSEARGL